MTQIKEYHSLLRLFGKDPVMYVVKYKYSQHSEAWRDMRKLFGKTKQPVRISSIVYKMGPIGHVDPTFGFMVSCLDRDGGIQLCGLA